MKIYEIDNSGSEPCIKATMGEIVMFIPTDPANSDYAEYLRYTEWVEAGNDPDEFWTQDAL